MIFALSRLLLRVDGSFANVLYIWSWSCGANEVTFPSTVSQRCINMGRAPLCLIGAVSDDDMCLVGGDLEAMTTLAIRPWRTIRIYLTKVSLCLFRAAAPIIGFNVRQIVITLRHTGRSNSEGFIC